MQDTEEVRVVPSRVQSPSSILTYKQCPRKYFYQYIARLPTEKSIHLVRGSVVHKVLEIFYAKDLSKIPDEQFPITAKVVLHELFRQEWSSSERELDALNLDQDDLQFYYEETKVMISNFFHYLLEKLQERQDLKLGEAFDYMKPRREVKLMSNEHHVMGFVDAVHEHDGKTYILDYKTSKKCEITPEYRLQLSIYGMLFAEIGQLPDEVGIFFLKHGQELRIPVTEAMVEHAKTEVHEVHRKTMSKKIEDYPMNPGPLCKWSTGKCDFYEMCFGTRTLDHYGGNLVQVGEKIGK